MHVRLGAQRARAVALPAGREGWYLALEAPPGEVEAVDVTPGRMPRRLRVVSVGRLLMFERGRFEDDHAYRLESGAGTLVVYLKPPSLPRAVRLAITEEEAAADLAFARPEEAP